MGALDVLEVPEVMRCVHNAVCSRSWKALFDGCVGGVGCAEGDALCATLCVRGRGGWALFAGGIGGVGRAGGDALCATPYAGGCRVESGLSFGVSKVSIVAVFSSIHAATTGGDSLVWDETCTVNAW